MNISNHGYLKYSGIACWMHDELTVLSPTADQLGSHTCKRL